MEILAIRIKNLASLEGITEIDFTQEPLQSSGIFAITGPTGSGKSTILDALCLALYAKTPRYDKAEIRIDIQDASGASISQSDVRGILRDGSTEGYAEVDFLATDGQRYRATWSVKRSKNKVDGNLQASASSLKNLDTGSDIGGKKTETLSHIEQLIGLSFEQFTRSVLLAQNDFTAFLKANKDDKSSLLEKLTGTHIYSEISKRIYERHRQEEEKWHLLNIQIQSIPSLSAEEVTQLQERKAELTRSIQSLEKTLDTCLQEIAWVNHGTELATGLQTAEQALIQAKEAKDLAQPRAHQLRQIEEVQHLRTLIDRLDNNQAQALEKQTALDKLETVLNTQEEALRHLHVKFQKVEEALKNALESREASRTDLAKARELDLRLESKKEQIDQEEKELMDKSTLASNHQSLYLAKQEEASSLDKEIQKQQDWKAGNIARGPVAENEHLILSKLKDAGGLLDSLSLHSAELTKLEAEITEVKDSTAQILKDIDVLEQAIKASGDTYQKETLLLNSIPIKEMQEARDATDRTIGSLLEAGAAWKLLYQSRIQKETLIQSIQENRDQLSEVKTQEASLLKQREEAFIQKNTTQDLLNKARLTASAGAESLRAQLKEGAPCPVCGSLEHPYAIHHPVLDEVLSGLEKEQQLRENAYNDLVQSHSHLQGVSTQLQAILRGQEAEVSTQEQALLQSEATFKPYAHLLPLTSLAPEQVSPWIQTQLEATRIKQETLSRQILQFNTQKEEVDSVKNTWDQQVKLASDTRFQYSTAQHTLNLLEERKRSILAQNAKADAALADIKVYLAPHFSNPQWFNSFQEQPENFTHRLTQFATEWRHTNEALEANINQQAMLHATLEGMKVQQETLDLSVSMGGRAVALLHEQYDQLSIARNALFEGTPVTEVEARLKSAVDRYQEMLNKVRSERETKQEETLQARSQKEHWSGDLDKIRLEALGLAGQLQASSPFEESVLRGLLAHTPSWVQEERKSLQALETTLTQSQSIVEDRLNRLNEHLSLRSTERTEQELNDLIADCRGNLDREKRAALQLEVTLQQDQENKLKIGALLQSMEAQSAVSSNWAKLNEVIGSADGKKFRQIAQEYTLDVLLQYANIHLATLSKRYLLQRIDQTLGLQVMDQDMGNEIRTVYSLSGGESFLVSLALALGLASLSSNRMKVGSLFIDEGFGSLDPHTLHVAMDALERLQHQGRRVGVISHVQEMTERIPVQIRISKEANGKSRVDIEGIYP
jgi:exonuclease SbcC